MDHRITGCSKLENPQGSSPAVKGIKHNLGVLSSMIQPLSTSQTKQPLGLGMSWGTARPAEKWDENHMDHRIAGCSKLENPEGLSPALTGIETALEFSAP